MGTPLVVREDFLEERESYAEESSGSRLVCSKHPALHSGLEMRPVSCRSPRRGEGKEVHPYLCEAPKDRDQSLWQLTEKLQEQTALRTA